MVLPAITNLCKSAVSKLSTLCLVDTIEVYNRNRISVFEKLRDRKNDFHWMID